MRLPFRGKFVDGVRLLQWAVSISIAFGGAALPLTPLLVAVLRVPVAPPEDPPDDAVWTSLAPLMATPPLPPTEEPPDEAPAAATAPPQKPHNKLVTVPVAQTAPPEPVPPPAAEDNDGLADAAVDAPTEPFRDRKRRFKKHKGHPTAAPAPCAELNPSIAQTDDAAYTVQRELLEYYAGHLVELNDLAGVSTHSDKVTGEKDGFRVGLKRCTLLYQAGLRSGDVVHSVNERHIVNVLQAVGAYFALRKETELVVALTRKGKPLQLTYTIPEEERRGWRGRTRKSSL